MKLVAFADTHGFHEGLEVPDGDILIFAGDMCMHGDVAEVAIFATWFNKLPHKFKFIVAGNHDWAFVREVSLCVGMFDAIYLQDDSCMLGDVCIYGAPWTPEFCGWAFMLERGNEIKAKWDWIPDCTGVLVTHGPPLKVLDNNGRENCGCWDLLGAVERVKPKVHIFGHIHSAYGKEDNKDTVFANVSMCDDIYDAVRKPMVFEV